MTEWDADGELNPVKTPMFKMQVEKEIAKETVRQTIQKARR